MIRPSRLITLAVVCAFAISTPAEAQFGGLMRKAKEKVAEKGVEQAADKMAPVTPGEQLTDDLLGKVLTGAQAADRVLDQRDKLTASHQDKNKQFSALTDKNQPVHAAYDQASSKISDCRSASFSALDDARKERYDAKVKALQADPNASGKMQLIAMKYAKQMGEAQKKQDPALMTKVQRDMMMEMVGADPFADMKKDSVATDAKCGKMPAQPAALVQEEKMRKELAAQDDSIRTLEAKAVNVGASASGIEQIRYLQLKERALSIMGRLAGQSRAKFSDEELEAVKKRLGDLEKVKRAL